MFLFWRALESVEITISWLSTRLEKDPLFVENPEQVWDQQVDPCSFVLTEEDFFGGGVEAQMKRMVTTV